MNHTSVFISIAATVLAAAVVFSGVRPVSLQREREHAAAFTSSVSSTGGYRRGKILSEENKLLVSTKTSFAGDGSKQAWREMDPAAEVFSGLIGTFTGGIDQTLEAILRSQNPTPTNDETGQSVRLTVSLADSTALHQYLTAHKITAGMVISEADGAIHAIVSTPSFDQNRYRISERYRASLTQTDALKYLPFAEMELPGEILRPLLDARFGGELPGASLLNACLRDEMGLGACTECDFCTLHPEYDAVSGRIRCHIVQLGTLLSAMAGSTGEVYRPYLAARTVDSVSRAAITETQPQVLGTIRGAASITLPPQAVFETEEG
ncbi:MAG: hypothetical protein IJV58_08155, partial [Oscillospiraceae bacterium]|nr:hypothetical protein [Oscillospiraceae bacterium]